MGERADRVWSGAFDAVFAPVMRRRLHVLVSEPLPEAPRGPVVLVANHVSWWDGFLLGAVRRALRPQAVLRTIALERELARHPVLRRIGGIGIDPASPSSILHALRAIARLRSDDFVLAYFPQGRIAPTHARPLGFHRGIDLALRLVAPATVIPVALHVEPLARFAPTAFVALGAPIDAATTNHVGLEVRVTRLLDDLLAFTAAHGEDAARAWPAFRPSTSLPYDAPVMRPRLAC
jgi:1-acyl-sn-glycerol-3-phosphate acyltransferase